MYLGKIILDKFFNSIQEEKLEKITSLEPNQRFEILKSMYSEQYGSEPSGILLYLLKNKVEAPLK